MFLVEPIAFFRACEPAESGPSIGLEERNGPALSYRLFGHPGTAYILETTSDGLGASSWMELDDFTLTNVWRGFDWTNSGEPVRLFQVRPK